MAARSKRARFQSDTRTDGPPRKKMKAAESIKQQLDILGECITPLIRIPGRVNTTEYIMSDHSLLNCV